MGSGYVEDRVVLGRPGERAPIDWSRAVVDAASVRAKEGPVDRPKPGPAAPGNRRAQMVTASRASAVVPMGGAV